MNEVAFVWLNDQDVIVAAGLAPSRDSYDDHVANHSMPDCTLLEVEQNLAGFIGGVYNHDTGEVALPLPAPIPEPGVFAAPPTSGITMENLIIALDEKEHGDPSKWQDLLAQAKSNTHDGQPS